MSMYEMMFPGGMDRAIVVMRLLGGFQKLSDAGRVRDGWIERDPDYRFLARLVTRNGGDNRIDYQTEIKWLQTHPLFVRDADHAYDSTYASFWFRVPTNGGIGPDAYEPIARDPVVDDEQRWSDALAHHLQLLDDPAQARHPSVMASRRLMSDFRRLLQGNDPDDPIPAQGASE